MMMIIISIFSRRIDLDQKLVFPSYEPTSNIYLFSYLFQCYQPGNAKFTICIEQLFRILIIGLLPILFTQSVLIKVCELPYLNRFTAWRLYIF